MVRKFAVALAALSGVASARCSIALPPTSPASVVACSRHEHTKAAIAKRFSTCAASFRPAGDQTDPSDSTDRSDRRTGARTLASHEAQVDSVDARQGTVTLSDSAGVHRLHVGEGTRVVVEGRSAPGLTALVPGDEVSATWAPDGRVAEIVLAGPPRPEAALVPSTPGASPNVPLINANAPNPSAPTPGQDPAPGATPHNVIPW